MKLARERVVVVSGETGAQYYLLLFDSYIRKSKKKDTNSNSTNDEKESTSTNPTASVWHTL